MKWNNTLKDNLPEDKAEVLISVNGVYYAAIFDSNKKTFQVEFELKNPTFKVGRDIIYWSQTEKRKKTIQIHPHLTSANL